MRIFLCKQSPLVSEDELTVLPTIRRKGAFLLRGEDKVNKCLYCGKETRNLKFCSYSCKGKFYSGKNTECLENITVKNKKEMVQR